MCAALVLIISSLGLSKNSRKIGLFDGLFVSEASRCFFYNGLQNIDKEAMII